MECTRTGGATPSLVIGPSTITSASRRGGARRSTACGLRRVFMCPSLTGGAPTETDALFYNRIGAYGVLSPVVGDLVLGWFTVTSTPFWSD